MPHAPAEPTLIITVQLQHIPLVCLDWLHRSICTPILLFLSTLLFWWLLCLLLLCLRECMLQLPLLLPLDLLLLWLLWLDCSPFLFRLHDILHLPGLQLANI